MFSFSNIALHSTLCLHRKKMNHYGNSILYLKMNFHLHFQPKRLGLSKSINISYFALGISDLGVCVLAGGGTGKDHDLYHCLDSAGKMFVCSLTSSCQIVHECSENTVRRCKHFYTGIWSFKFKFYIVPT